MSLIDFDNRFFTEGYKHICGIDEAGRGPLAGSVFAAAVILPHGFVIPELDDSKKLTPKKRDMLYDIIIENALAYHIAQADESEIDSMNILNATMLVMCRAHTGLSIATDIILVDGNKSPDFGNPDIPSVTVIGGDAKSAVIAAASILAKVARDRYLVELDAKYPQYMFAQHKGYGTKLHYEKLDEFGPCPAHRESFLKKWKAGRKDAEVKI